MSDTLSKSQGIALVTGASRGIGRAVARRMARDGHRVAINYRQSRAAAEELVDEIESTGGSASVFQGDMSDPEQAVKLSKVVESELGPVTVLVNNAGITRDRLLLQMNEEDWAATWTTDLEGPRALARSLLAKMARRGYGRIVNVSSVVGVTGNAGQANYAAAKSALLGLTAQLAMIGAGHGVTVNCVVPGYIATDATSHLTDEQQRSWLDRIPMDRYASVEEVAEAIAFLSGEGASYITGQCLAVDGGLLAKAGAGLA